MSVSALVVWLLGVLDDGNFSLGRNFILRPFVPLRVGRISQGLAKFGRLIDPSEIFLSNSHFGGV